MSRILYRGGTVYASVPGASALLVDGTRIAWVGSDASSAGLGEPDAVVDLEGAWLAPAFVDAHVHVVAAGLAMIGLELSDALSLTAVLDRVQRAAAHTAPDALIWGTGWDETQWGPQRPPTPEELARAGGGRPVYLARVDVHSAAASPRLLRAAGLPVVDDPVSGVNHHRVRATARRLLTPAQRRDAADTMLAAGAAQGIGMVHECSGPIISDADELAIVRAAAKASGVDLVAYWGEAGLSGVAAAQALEAEPAGDLFVDGSIGSHTAALSSPYADSEGCGTLFLPPAQIAEHLIAATAAGAQAGFHVIGDAAVTAVVEGFRQAEASVGLAALASGRHRLEHLEMCDDQHLPELARFGIIASVQPAFDARWGGADGMYAQRLGAGRAAGMNNFAALLDAGIALAFGSDAPVTPLDPWGALRAAMKPAASVGGAKTKVLSERAAFTAHTRGGYRAARRDGGRLQPGADATFAIWADTGELSVRVPDRRLAAWSTDPRAGVPGLPDPLESWPTCVATVVHGRTVFDVDVPLILTVDESFRLNL